MMQTLKRYSRFSSTKFQLFKNKYLIPEAPPKKHSGYSLFTNEIYPQLEYERNLKNYTRAKLTALQKWNSLPEQQKTKYENKADELTNKYKEHQEKFVVPFRKRNLMTVLKRQTEREYHNVSHNEVRILTKQKRMGLSEQQLKDYKQKAKLQNIPNQAIIQQYEIPQKKFKNFGEYLKEMTKKSDNNENSQMKELEHLKNYRLYEEDYNNKFQRLANFYNLTVPELQKKIKQVKIANEKKQFQTYLKKKKLLEQKMSKSE